MIPIPGERYPEMSDTLTHSIRVLTQPFFVPERSSPAEMRFYFAYRILIANQGIESARLVSRHWTITDAMGRRKHLRGAGVVGKEPLLLAGQSFEYTSFCPLSTPYGTMEGFYRMQRVDGSEFKAIIAPFALTFPALKN